MKKIGILGGTFDPPHKGHLKIAKAAIKKLGLDKILFIPCNKHILKEREAQVSSYHRSNMVALLCSKDERFIIETFELEKGGVSYTIETLSFLKRKYKNLDFYLLLGKDSYDTLDLWKSPEKIRKLATIAVFPRGEGKIVLKNKNDILINMRKIDVSSSEIREEISRQFFSKNHLPEEVAKYIKKEGLYFRKEN